MALIFNNIRRLIMISLVGFLLMISGYTTPLSARGKKEEGGHRVRTTQRDQPIAKVMSPKIGNYWQLLLIGGVGLIGILLLIYVVTADFFSQETIKPEEGSSGGTLPSGNEGGDGKVTDSDPQDQVEVEHNNHDIPNNNAGDQIKKEDKGNDIPNNNAGDQIKKEDKDNDIPNNSAGNQIKKEDKDHDIANNNAGDQIKTEDRDNGIPNNNPEQRLEVKGNKDEVLKQQQRRSEINHNGGLNRVVHQGDDHENLDSDSGSGSDNQENGGNGPGEKNQQRGKKGEPKNEVDLTGQDDVMGDDVSHNEQSGGGQSVNNDEKKGGEVVSNEEVADDEVKYDEENSGYQLTPNVGFQNTGNSCFLNAAIHPLTQVIPKIIKEGFKSVIGWQKDFKDDFSGQAEVTKAFSRLVEVLVDESQKGERKAIRDEVEELQKALGKVNPDLNNGKQEDALLVMTTILQAIEESLKKKYTAPMKQLDLMPGVVPSIEDIKAMARLNQKTAEKKQSLINDLFDGTGIEVTQCAECGFTHIDVKRIRELKLPVMARYEKNKKIRSLKKASMAFENPKKLAASSYFFYCDNQGRPSKMVIRQEKVLIPPPILLIHLDRFRNLEEDQYKNLELNGLRGVKKSDKHKHKVAYPARNYKREGWKYDLVSIVVHLGNSATYGHYITFVQDLTTGVWWKLDDSSAEKTKMIYVEDMSEYTHPNYPSATPMVLLYKRQGLSPLNGENKIKGVGELPSLIEGSLVRTEYKRKDLKKWWKAIQKKIKKEELLLQSLENSLYSLFEKYQKKVDDYLQNSYEKLPVIAGECISSLKKDLAKAKEKGKVKKVKRIEEKIEEWEKSQKEIVNTDWQGYFDSVPGLVKQFLKGVKEYRQHPALLKQVAKELKKWKQIENIVSASDWESEGSLVDMVINSISTGKAWLEEILRLVKGFKKKGKAVENRLAFLDIPLQEELLGLKELILRELIKHKKVDRDRLENSIADADDKRRVDAYMDLYVALYESFPGVKKKKYGKKQLYAYLDLIDYVLFELGYIQSLFVKKDLD